MQITQVQVWGFTAFSRFKCTRRKWGLRSTQEICWSHSRRRQTEADGLIHPLFASTTAHRFPRASQVPLVPLADNGAGTSVPEWRRYIELTKLNVNKKMQPSSIRTHTRTLITNTCQTSAGPRIYWCFTSTRCLVSRIWWILYHNLVFVLFCLYIKSQKNQSCRTPVHNRSVWSDIICLIQVGLLLSLPSVCGQM